MTAPSYHHGDLRAALLAAAEIILERDGPAALTLRAAARAAGVSHAAPTHHFGDLTGLLSDLASVGYDRFRDHLETARLGGPGLTGMGRAYVRFALGQPNLFLLMFRGDRLDRQRPTLRAAKESAFAVLRGATGGSLADAIAAWSLVHGFALLAIDHQLPADQPVEPLLDAVLATWRSPPSNG